MVVFASLPSKGALLLKNKGFRLNIMETPGAIGKASLPLNGHLPRAGIVGVAAPIAVPIDNAAAA